MQTAFRSTFGKSYKDIKPNEEPIPAIDPHEVLIKVKAVSLNFRDIIIAQDRYAAPIKKNVVPISDGAGEVVKVGSEVNNIQVGDKVVVPADPTHFYGVRRARNYGLGSSLDGMLQQYKAVLGESAVKLPIDSHLSFGEAACLPCAGVTAWNCLYGGGVPFIAGQTVLLLGTGGVSMIALILARAAGARTIITSSSDEKLQYVKEKYGVDHTINYRNTPDWDVEVLKLTNGEGVDFVIENGGAGTIARSISSTKGGGQVLLVGFLAQPEVMPDVTQLILRQSCSVRGIAIGHKMMLEQMVKFIHTKQLHMPIDKEFEFSDVGVQAAYEHLERGPLGKVVININ